MPNDHREQRPVISFDCGVDDRLMELNRLFHEHLQRFGIEHRYAEVDGGK